MVKAEWQATGERVGAGGEASLPLQAECGRREPKQRLSLILLTIVTNQIMFMKTLNL